MCFGTFVLSCHQVRLKLSLSNSPNSHGKMKTGDPVTFKECNVLTHVAEYGDVGDEEMLSIEEGTSGTIMGAEEGLLIVLITDGPHGGRFVDATEEDLN